MDKKQKPAIEETFKLAVKNNTENKIDIATDLYNQVLEVNSNHKQALNNLGVIFHNKNENLKAKNFFEKAIEIDPNYTNALNNLGNIFKILLDYQKAKDCYEKAIVINPRYIDAYNNLGGTLKELGENQKAKDCYEKAIEIDPNYVAAHNNLGNIFKELGKNQEAKDCYEKAIKINPNYAPAHNNLGNIFKELGENQKAINCYEKAIKINPNYAPALNNLGNIFKELGENQKAINCYEKAIEINPNYVAALNNLGGILQELGENQKAKDCYEKAIKIDPNYVPALNNLGNIFKELGENQKAKDCYEKAIKIDPKYIDIHNNLGIILQELGEYQKAKNCFEKGIEVNPDHIGLINSLSSLLRTFIFDSKIEANKDNIKKLFLILFRNNNISHQYITSNAKLLLLSDSKKNQLFKAINSNTLLENNVLQNLIKENLFHLMLQKAIMPDKFLEKLLVQLRYEILLILKNSNTELLNDYFNFIVCLAEQCWLNEYVYTQSKIEINKIAKLKNKIENSDEINEAEIAILGAYIPLNSSKIIINKLLNHKSSNVLFDDLVNMQIKEPLREKELVKSITSLDVIDDMVSKEVRQQYEENPYPRWRFTNKCLPTAFFTWLNAEIKPNRIDYDNKFNNPNVLIAGCGTGNHSIQATKYKNSNILAVDLSLASLAYAKRKTEELGYKNIEYLHADILQLNKLNKKFDIIESAGTLHHMKDPVAGLKVLLNILEPHGFLLLGLYSKKARQHITKTRELIKKKKFKNTNEDIINFRQYFINEKLDPLLQKTSESSDFYSTSNVRDLLFHVQEHNFTIPEISKILNDLDLEFLGFITTPFIKNKFSELFPNDKKNISLDNWHQFEINNHDSFFGMYQFWVRKK